MNSPPALRGRATDALLEALPPLTLVVGKGGVGKTTCAVGLTACLADRGHRTLLVSTDPAASLGTVLGVTLPAGERRGLAELPGCAVLQLDASVARAAFLARWRDTMVTIMDRGTYLDVEDIEGLVDAAFPGADEIFALLSLAELLADPTPNWDRLVVDTAPTGHTLRLLSLPETFDAMISLLDAMQAKHRFMVSALTHRYRSDAADDFLVAMKELVTGFRASLADDRKSTAVLVVRAEALVVAETLRYATALTALHIGTVAILVQALPEDPSEEARHALSELKEIGPPLFFLPARQRPPVGVASIRELMRSLRELRGDAAVRVERKRLHPRRGSAVMSLSGGGPPAATGIVRSLTIVGGKGGVGKTTVSTALALAASLPQQPGRVLLVSTDPAPSIGDALGMPDAHWARRIPQECPGVPRLDIWQMDATAAFEDLRDRYRERIDELFEAWIGRGIDAAHDRTILRDLLALAPPGVDELYALSALGEMLATERYARIIVDPAPTGHLLRLLEMPSVALDWSHRLMRLLLKYREIASLGDVAQELVGFTRRTRALDQLLHDPMRAGVLLVTLDEPVVLAESSRLSRAIQGAGIEVLGTLVNRAGELSDSLAGSEMFARGSTILAPEADRPLIGVGAITDWCHRWQARDLGT